MKKYLSLALALLMSLSCVSYAAPSLVGVVENVSEATEKAPEYAQEAVVASEEQMTSDVLFYDDFESYDAKKITGLTPAYRKEGVNASFAMSWNGTKDATWNIIDENGYKVLHISQLNGANSNIGFDLINLNVAQPGVYTFSYRMKETLGDGATGVDALWGGSGSSTWYQYTMYTESTGAASTFSPATPAIPTNFATSNLGNWFDIEYQYIIRDNGNGTCSFLVKNSRNGWVGTASNFNVGQYVGRIKHYFFFQPASTATGNIYLDNLKLTYGDFVTVKYVDENGNTIKTAEGYQGGKITLADKATLGTAYTPAYNINGVPYSCGDTIEIPADVTGEYTVNVTRFPVNVPENVVLLEDYETRTLGNAVMDEFAYSSTDFSGVKIGLGDAGYASSRTDLFAVSPDNAENKTLKVENAKAAYAPGFHIENLSFTKPGKYNISYKLYTDASYDKFATIYYSARLDGNELKRWVYPTLNASQRNTWVNVSYDIEVYEENGVRKIKYDTDKVMDCAEVSTIKFYVEIVGLSASQTANVWFDDVMITRKGFGSVSFVDENNNALCEKVELTAATGTYKLPTANDLSLGYNAEFTLPDGKTYYPGMTFRYTTGGEYVFTIKKSDVIFFESYDNKTKANADVVAEYTAGQMAGDMTNTSYVSDADANGNKTSIVTSTGNATGQKDLYLFTGLNLTDVGLYKFSIDAKLTISGNKSAEDKSVVVKMYSASSWSPIHNGVTLEDGNPVTVEGYIEVYEKEDGSKAFCMPTRTDASSASFPISTGINNVWTRVLFNNIASSSTAEYTVTFDNLKVEYTNESLLTPNSYKENSIRVNDPAGLRFKSSVANIVRENNDLVEYGFIVTRQAILTNLGIDVNDFTMSNSDLPSNAYVKGVNYGMEDGKKVDRIFEIKDNTTFFTAAVYNIPASHYKDVIVVRPFVKTEDRVVYGAPMAASIYEVAQRIASSDDYGKYKVCVDKILNGEEI